MEQFDLNISGRQIPVVIHKLARYKRCSLRVTDKGVKVTVPLFYADRKWKKFIDTNATWILKKYTHQKSKIDNLPELIDGGIIPFRGESYPVELLDIEDIVFTGEKFNIPDNANKKYLLSQWYIKESEKIVLELIEIWHSEFGKKLQEVRLKNMNSRWGSCTVQGKVSLNWRLIMAPETVFEYVFIHELCHLQVRSHGAEFWVLVEKDIPNYRKHRLWLRKHGYMLTNFPESVKSSSTVATVKL